MLIQSSGFKVCFALLGLLWISATGVLGQVTEAPGGAQGFSEKTLKEVKASMVSYNNVSQQKVCIWLSFVQLDGVKKGAKRPANMPKGGTLQDLVKTVKPQENSPAIVASFEDLQRKVDKRNQQLFDKLPDKANTLAVSVSVAIWHRSAAKDAKRGSLYRVTYYKGSAVPASWEEAMKHFIEDTKNAQLDFDDPAFKKNDEYLRDLLATLSSLSFPAMFDYTDAGSPKTFDTNIEKECQTFPSFQTSPVRGMPWKCIKADNTFQPVGVKIEYVYGSNAKFRVKDAANFKLKSDTPDAQGLLWISAGPNAKETAIVPVFNNKDYDLGGLNVVAYPKRKEKLVIVQLEEYSDDVQVVPFETKGLSRTTIVVSSGPNGKLDRGTRSDEDDQVIIDPVSKKKVIVAGPNGECDTHALNFIQSSGVDDQEFQVYLAELKKHLDSLYGVVNIEWDIVKTEKKAMNYDININGYFDTDGLTKNPDGTFSPSLSDENDLLRKDIKTYGGAHVLYLIGLSHPSYPLGVTIYPDNTSAIVFPGECADEVAKLYTPIGLELHIAGVSMHELGHTLGVGHTVSADEHNTMGAERYPKDFIFRKFQWDIMHGRLPREKDLVTKK